MNFSTHNRRLLVRLSSLFFVQLLLIFGFVLFGAFLSNNMSLNESLASGSVKFIRKESRISESPNIQQQYETPTNFRVSHSDTFQSQFELIRADVTISEDIPERMHLMKFCFREGTHEQRASQDVNNKTDDSNESPVCLCRPEWHGDACSQPEIIWRAFIASRQPINRSPRVTRTPHNVFYIIHGVTSINIETLEIQMMELSEVASLFVLCDLIKSDDPSLLMRHQMNKGFLEKFKDRVLLIKDDTCSSSNVYRRMKKILGAQMRPLDVLINGHADEILNAKAINYLKWHNNWPQPLRFRLKWNVYGFFYQHPENTVISSVACQLSVVDQFYRSDPDKILANSLNPTVVTVGDLNHYGGWFCEYCYQPIDIIKKLHLDSKILANKSSDPLKGAYHRKPVVNIEYILNLIQYGHYIDGKLELTKQRHYQDSKYFTPDSVAKNRWKFDNVVTNFYTSWDDDFDGDY